MLKPIDSSRFHQYVNVSVSAFEKSIWIGATVIKNTRIFIWEDGSRVDDYFKNWATNEPNDQFGNENCIKVLGSISFSSKKWNDAPCHVALNSVCKFD
jgi:hypothetical protein